MTLPTDHLTAVWFALVSALFYGGITEETRAEPRVAIYGLAEASVSVASNIDWLLRVTVRSGQSSASRSGLRGCDLLGSNLEMRFGPDAGFGTENGAGSGQGGAPFYRHTWIGLGCSFGTITVGRQYRPEARAVLLMDPFRGNSIASPNNTHSNLVFRSENGRVYAAPDLSVWQAFAMTLPGEQAGRALDHLGFAMLYRGYPFQLAYGWDKRINAKINDGRVWQSIGGSFDIGVATLYTAYRSRKENVASLGERSYWLGASVPLGAFTLRGVVGALAERGAAHQKASAIGLGIAYKVSKHCDLYSRYARLRNRNDTRVHFGDGVSGRAPRSLVIGLRMNF